MQCSALYRILSIERKAPAARLTPKQRELANLQERANKIQSRFSISNYSKSQVVSPTPEMLATVEDLINPETGEVMNPTKKGSRGKNAQLKGFINRQCLIDNRSSREGTAVFILFKHFGA